MKVMMNDKRWFSGLFGGLKELEEIKKAGRIENCDLDWKNGKYDGIKRTLDDEKIPKL